MADPHAIEAWLVDGFNVLHAHLLRGRDRRNWRSAERRRLVIEQATRLSFRGERVCIVFDGEPPGEEATREDPLLRIVFAPDADDRILQEVRAAPRPDRVAVVTGDRAIQERARFWGARVVAPRAWLARCAQAGSVRDR